MASSSISPEEELAPFLSTRQIIVHPISTLSAMFLVYGFYILLFGIAVRSLARQLHRPNRKLFLCWTITLFALMTILVIIQAWSLIRQSIIDFDAAKSKDYLPLIWYNAHDMVKVAHFTILNVLPVLQNFITDTMLIHRCYVIWNSRQQIGIPLILVSAVINAIGLASTIMGAVAGSNMDVDSNVRIYQIGNNINSGYFLANMSFNGFLTLLTAGRIWYVTHEARSIIGGNVSKRYKTIVAIILESGILYPSVQLVQTIINYAYDPDAQGSIPFDISPLCVQAAGIAPTLIITRLAKGKAMDTFQGDMAHSTMHFAPGISAVSVVSQSQSVQLQQQPSNEALDRKEDGLKAKGNV
ncbi:hypothetical protein E1B28_000065 [Marasmius oreades]|uniref:Uncharacterized protein n=1 Tax=Marasmius oreades TaxID=181124 RepID=A0A9P7V0H9_9AGAR|nr:uncharacterized protein E1B28_000065 [Marasmius oreades]KAG7098091.1 hypothetical protein E1B28_000065 [Marasmius oreades]